MKFIINLQIDEILYNEFTLIKKGNEFILIKKGNEFKIVKLI